MKISVCMATYNGEKYIKEQLDSILYQLSEQDEVIISDDSSSDKTVEIVKFFNDSRIKIFENQKFKSPIFNFENALKYATGDIIVLTDQDDLWGNNKIEVIRNSFVDLADDTVLVMFNGVCINDKGEIIYNSLFDYIGIHEGLIANIMKNSFIGCNIAFNKKLLDFALPFPADIPMHDMWLGSCAYIFGNVRFIDEKIFMYRLHDSNYTGGKTTLSQKILWRLNIIKNIVIRYIRVAIK